MPHRSDPRRAPHATGAEGHAGQQDHRKGTARLTPDLGPCRCDQLPDVIVHPEPPCDRDARREEARARVAELERFWALMRWWSQEVAA